MTFPTIFLIVFRECLEALLIVATLHTALRKLELTKLIKPVYFATFLAAALSLALLIGNAMLGNYLQSWYLNNEALIEAVLAIVSAVFITWAALFLHQTFVSGKISLIKRINDRLENGAQGIFFLAFAAVFREGLEIVFFLSSSYLTSTPTEIVGGFVAGLTLSVLVLFLLFRGAKKVSFATVFRMTTFLLILFAAGLLAKGIHEFSEIGYLPSFYQLTLPLIPANNFLSDLIKSLFGITKVMDVAQIGVYLAYTVYLTNRLLFNHEKETNTHPPTGRAAPL